MATIEHKGTFGVGDTIVYEYSSQTLYGQKLLKYVFVDEIGEYRYITEPVKIRDNEVIKYLHGALELHDPEQMPKDLPLKWTKDPEFKKGDILLGKDGDKTMIFVYISDRHVERLTPRSDMWTTSEQGYSTLSDFTKNFGPLKVANTAHPSYGKFSAL